MKISIGADHGGLQLRQSIIELLQSKDYTVIDHGAFTQESVDYPDYAHLVAQDVAEGRADYGVVVCTSGIGVSISANKVKGVRAALVMNEDMARYSRLHNNANVICLGQKYVTAYLAGLFLDIFLKTPFEGGRHATRVHKIETP